MNGQERNFRKNRRIWAIAFLLLGAGGVLGATVFFSAKIQADSIGGETAFRAAYEGVRIVKQSIGGGSIRSIAQKMDSGSCSGSIVKGESPFGKFRMVFFDISGKTLSCSDSASRIALVEATGIFGGHERTIRVPLLPTDGGGNTPQPVPSPDIKVNGSDNAVSATSGQRISVSWSAVDDATSCTGSGSGWSGSKSVGGGQEDVTVQSSSTYTLTCTGPGGTGSDSVQVIVSGGGTPLPNPNLRVNGSDGPLTVNEGQNLNITWNAVSNATSCSGSGNNWTGPKNISGGSDNLSAAGGNTYILTCTGPGGTGSDSVQVIVSGGGQPLRDVSYKGSLKLDVYPALDRNPNAPVVVMLHSGGWFKGDKTDDAARFGRDLSARGITVIAPNYTLVPNGYYPTPLFDVDCALRWTAANAASYGFSSNNISLGGYSAGAHLALLYSFRPSSYQDSSCSWGSSPPVRSVIALAAPTNLSTLQGDVRTMAMNFLNGASPSEASPSTYAGTQNDKRYLLLQARDDELVSFLSQGEPFYNQLLQWNPPQVQSRWYESGGHLFAYSDSNTYRDAVSTMATFLGR